MPQIFFSNHVRERLVERMPHQQAGLRQRIQLAIANGALHSERPWYHLDDGNDHHPGARWVYLNPQLSEAAVLIPRGGDWLCVTVVHEAYAAATIPAMTAPTNMAPLGALGCA